MERGGKAGTAIRGLTAVAVGVAAWGPAPPARAVFVAGVCTFDLTLTSTANVGVELHRPTWAVDGDGTCLATGHGTNEIAATLDGELTGMDGVVTGLAGCAAGVYEGNLTFTADPAVAEIDSVVVAAVAAGPVMEITVVTPPRFAAAGAFAQTSTGATTTCPTGGNTSTTWFGALVFEDPALS